MNIQITSRKFKAKDSLKDFITENIKSFERFNDDILDVNVVLSFTHQKDSIKNVEINLHLPGKVLAVSTESDDFYKAINDACDKMVIQLKKTKTKKIALKR